MLTMLGFVCFLLWACISLANDYSYQAGAAGLRICCLIMLVGTLGAIGAVVLIPPEEPAAPDLHDPVLTQNGTMRCTFLNASEPSSGYVCLPVSARGAGP